MHDPKFSFSPTTTSPGGAYINIHLRKNTLDLFPALLTHDDKKSDQFAPCPAVLSSIPLT
jgi:hypothetical protein